MLLRTSHLKITYKNKSLPYYQSEVEFSSVNISLLVNSHFLILISFSKLLPLYHFWLWRKIKWILVSLSLYCDSPAVLHFLSLKHHIKPEPANDTDVPRFTTLFLAVKLRNHSYTYTSTSTYTYMYMYMYTCRPVHIYRNFFSYHYNYRGTLELPMHTGELKPIRHARNHSIGFSVGSNVISTADEWMWRP